ncbi:glycosyl hydrolase [Glycomyces endophyticus]|uniref:Glycosyl hydrolase n=1 Tax=Glycomyces endophyticus TaxID=480996 RepID=A0ABP4RQZ9_9ACTN
MRTSRIEPELAAAFREPPAEARAMVRWWWFGTSITEADIDDQLESMARAGIGGVEAAFVYPLAPAQPHAFGSPPFLALVGHAARRARSLGLRFDLTLGSGWSYGGAHVPAPLAAQRLRWEERPIGPHAARLHLPGRWPGDRPVAAFLADGAPGEHDGAFAPLELDGDDAAVPPGRGPRTLLLATAGPTGQQVKRSSTGAEGPVLDHYSHAATAHHLAAVAEPLLEAAGAEHVTAVFCDSLEVYHADWTPDLAAEFRARRGYDPLPHLHHLHAHRPEGARFRADFHRTLADLLEDRFLAPIHAWARERGVRFRVQNYGAPPARVSGYRHADMIEGEGWGRHSVPRTKWAASAAHHLDTPVVSSETWTWINSPSFRARPIDFKGEAHEHLLAGVNHFIGHGWPASPRGAADPGWAFYASGAITDRNAWWPAAPALFRYLQRLSWAMRQGEHVADLALWLPYEDAYASFGPGEELDLYRRSTALLGDVPAALRRAGHDFDVIDARTPAASILRRHKALVIAGATRLSEEDESRIRALAAAGLPVIAVDADLLPEARRTTAPDLTGALRDLVTPDAETGHPDVGVVHRRLDDAELYLLANTGPEPRTATLTPRTPYASWETWDAHDGAATPGHGPIRLALAPYEARIVATSPRPGPPAPPPPGPADPIRLADWHFTGPDGSTAPVTLPHVWEAHGLTGTTGTYTAAVELHAPLPTRLVLGTAGLPVPARTARQPQSFQAHAAEPLAAVAVAVVNGTEAGVLWDLPCELDLGDRLREGENRIELRVHGTSVPAMRSDAWQRVYTDATAAHGRRFAMQEMDLVREPTRTGLFTAPELHRPRPTAP